MDPAIDPQVLQQILGLGSVDQRWKLLQGQQQDAAQTAQGVPIDYRKGKGTPLLLASLANLVSAGVGGYQEGQARAGQRKLIDDATSARAAAGGRLMGAQAPDLQSLLTAPDGEVAQRTQAAKDAIGGQRSAGLLALLSGDPQLAGAGKEILGEATKGSASLLGMPQERQQYAAGQRSAVAAGPQPELGGMRPDVFKLLTERKTAEAHAKTADLGAQSWEHVVIPDTGEAFLVNKKTGEARALTTGAGGAPAGGAKPIGKLGNTWIDKLKQDLDPNGFRAGALKGNQERANAADRLLQLAVDPLTGQPANLTPQQMTELSTSLASLLSGGGSGGSEGQRHELTPYTKGRSFAELMQWLTDKPQGTEQQAFVKQMIDTAKREKQTVEDQIRKAQVSRLPAHLAVMQRYPDAAGAVLEGYGFKPGEVDFKTGKYTPKAADAAPDAQPQRMKGKDGKTYVLRDGAWEEE